MTVTRRLRMYCLLPAACLLGMGCAKIQPKPTPPDTQDALPNTDIHNRVSDLVAQLATLDSTVAQLPGSGSSPEETEKNHRALMRESFDKLVSLLPMLEGMDPSGDFRASLRVIAGSRTQLTNSSMELVAEPTIDTGLRATSRALRVVNRDAFGSDADVAKLIDEIDHRMADLDTEHGPLHRVVVAQTMSTTTAVLHQMGTLLSEKAGPATQPATAPVAPAARATAAPAPVSPAPVTPAAPPAEPAKVDAPKPDSVKTDVPKTDAPDAPKP